MAGAIVPNVAVDEYSAQRQALDERLQQLRRQDAPGSALLLLLWDVAVLELRFGRPDGARAVLAELGPLRSHGVEAEIIYYLVASRVAAVEGDGPRGVWLAERAVLLSRREVPNHLPNALHVLAMAFDAAGREEERRWAEIEAVQRFEESGQFERAWLLIHSWAEVCSDDAPVRLQRLVALATRADNASAQVWFLRELGDWHAMRAQYLPARHAYERSLAFADQVSHEESSPSRLNLGALECRQGHDENGLRLFDEVLATTDSPVERALSLHGRASALHNLHRHREAKHAAEEAAEALDALERHDDAAECWALARLSQRFAFLHRLPRWLINHDDSTAERSRGWRRRARWGLVVGNVLLVGAAAALANALHDTNGGILIAGGVVWLLLAQAGAIHRHLRDTLLVIDGTNIARP